MGEGICFLIYLCAFAETIPTVARMKRKRNPESDFYKPRTAMEDGHGMPWPCEIGH